VKDDNFNEIVRKKYADDWAHLNAEWQAYIAALDYGFDYDRMTIDFQSGKPLPVVGQAVTIATDRGWQSSGIELEAGKSYDLTATGRYQIAAEENNGVTSPWPCEPGGVTIDYHDGRPLGMLIGAIDSRDGHSKGTSESFAEPFGIGLRTTLKPIRSGTLYLRVNDAASGLADNRGTLNVTIRPAQ
jgi:hypothetical protein